jgi:hypothetical protein
MNESQHIRILYTILIGLLLLTFLSNVGCGYIATARNHCTLGTQICDNLFGEDSWSESNRLADAEKNIQTIQAELLTLQTMSSLLITQANDSTTRALELYSLMMTIQMSVTNNQNFVDSVTADLKSEIDSLLANVETQQAQINDMLGDMIELEAQDTIVEYILPCGDRNGIYDETIVRTKSGKLLAYFEDGGARFLTLLVPGNYQTTDKTPRCSFTINSAGQIVNGHR